MAIAGVTDYAGVYRTEGYRNAADNRPAAGERRAERTDETAAQSRTQNTNASGVASTGQTTKAYIRGLEEKYGVHITIGKNTTAKSFKDYMLGSAGGNNVYLESNIADKMAADPSYAAKYEELIAKVPQQGKQAEQDIEQLSNGKSKMVASGMQIHRDGKVTYWGVSVNKEPGVRLGTKYRKMAEEKLEKQRENKKELKEQAEELKEKREAKTEAWEALQDKRSTQAESMDGLVQQLAAGGRQEPVDRVDIRI